jgi:hypothetical protein
MQEAEVNLSLSLMLCAMVVIVFLARGEHSQAVASVASRVARAGDVALVAARHSVAVVVIFSSTTESCPMRFSPASSHCHAMVWAVRKEAIEVIGASYSEAAGEGAVGLDWDWIPATTTRLTISHACIEYENKS